MVRKLIAFFAITATMLMTGCATTTMPSNSIGSVQHGTVVQVNEVKLAASNSAKWAATGAAGALSGAIATSIANKQNWQVRGAISTIGAVVGGIGGNAAVDLMGAKGYEYVVALDSGRSIVVAQPQPDGFIVPGTAVLVITSAGVNRVVANNTGAVSVAAKPVISANVSASSQPTARTKTAAVSSGSPTQVDAQGRRFMVVDGMVYYGAAR